MNNEKKIQLTFDLEQVANDVLSKCNLISQSIRDEAMDDIKANVLEPDNPETRSIVNRALTEAFGEVKVICQRYLKVGRTIDNNVLERMVKGVVYVQDSQGLDTDEIDHLIYESVKLELYIPNFNVAVTDSLKSNIHKYVVDYIMWRFLQDQLADKAGEYKTLADGEDRAKIIKDLNARDRFNMRKPAWV